MLFVKVATTNTRGFLENLFNAQNEKVKFVYNKQNVYEINNHMKTFFAKLIHCPIFDILGVFQVVRAENVKEDVCFSYNRFLKTDKPYVIFLENPSALVNYCWERPKYFMTKRKLRKCFSDSNLKAIVCMSKACFKYINNLYDIPKNVKILQNYPLVKDDFEYSFNNIKFIVRKKMLECLYISADFELKGGRDILEVLKKLEKMQFPVHITFITRKSSLRNEDLEIIKQMKNASLVEFNLSKSELDEYYKNSAVLLNPTRGDSFSLVTLEAMKYGCAILATDVYAIKEMDIDGYNGYLTKSMIHIWDDDGTLNKHYRKKQKELLRSGNIDYELVKWMYEKLVFLSKNRDQLETMCFNSLKLARNADFSADKVLKMWNEILLKVKVGME